MDEQNKVYVCNGMLFGLKKNEALIHAPAWRNPENIMLGKRSQTQKNTCCVISFTQSVQNR